MSTDNQLGEKTIKQKPIFPDIEYERKISGIELQTYVRILRGGKYYTLLFKRSVSFPLGEVVDPKHVSFAYQRLVEDVYLAMHFHRLPDWQEPDKDQTPEDERLKSIFSFFAINHTQQTEKQ